MHLIRNPKGNLAIGLALLPIVIGSSFITVENAYGQIPNYLIPPSFDNTNEEGSKWFTSDEIRDIARLVTVRVYEVNSESLESIDLGVIGVSGSGVIIDFNQSDDNSNLHLVLTNEHVLPTSGKAYVQTHDGLLHHAFAISEIDFNGNDIGLLWFRSPYVYQNIPIEPETIGKVKKGDEAYVSGFPCELSTLEALCPAEFSFLEGQVYPIDRSLRDGYQFGLTHPTKEGTSGGPILNKQGHLIGINGRGRTTPGNSQYQYADGSGVPEVFEGESLALGIPIDTYLRFLPEQPLTTYIPEQSNLETYPILALLGESSSSKQITSELPNNYIVIDMNNNTVRFWFYVLPIAFLMSLLLLGCKSRVNTSSPGLESSPDVVVAPDNPNNSKESEDSEKLKNSISVVKSGEDIRAIAEIVTVLISGRGYIGSGVLIDADEIDSFQLSLDKELIPSDDKLYVLTASHVVGIEPGAMEDPYSISTHDGKTHAINYYNDIYKSTVFDVAIIEFESDESYISALIGGPLQLESLVYISGWKSCKGGELEFNSGKVKAIAERFPPESVSDDGQPYFGGSGREVDYSQKDYNEGYRLQYSNYTMIGMSGGPVLDESGSLVAIHGKPGFHKEYQYDICPELTDEHGDNWGISIEALRSEKS